MKHRVLGDESLDQSLLLVVVVVTSAEFSDNAVSIIRLLNSIHGLLVLVNHIHDSSTLFFGSNSCIWVRQQIFKTVKLCEGRVVSLKGHEVGHRESTRQQEEHEGAG